MMMMKMRWWWPLHFLLVEPKILDWIDSWAEEGGLNILLHYRKRRRGQAQEAPLYNYLCFYFVCNNEVRWMVEDLMT